MDPDTALVRMRAAIETLTDRLDPAASDAERMTQVHGAVTDMCDSATALDGWLTQGGFLPEDWKRSDRELRAQLRAAEAELADVHALFSDYRLRHETIIPLLQAGKVEEAREAARGFS